MSDKIRVSFMFLGGLPDLLSDAGRAWKNCILYARDHHPEYLQKIMFVVHPISKEFKLSVGWKRVFGSSIRFYALTKPDEHLKTAWATRSLVDATILMIRKSFELSRFVQKFVLLDPTSCPLYNLKVLYNTVTSNRLNWLDSPLQNECEHLRVFRAKDHTAPSLRCTDDDPSHCFRNRDCSFWSQWCILDVLYLRDIIKANIVKDEIAIDCPKSGAQVNQIVVKNQKTPADRSVSATLGALVDPVYQKPCVASDELYFGMYLKRNRTIRQFLDVVFVVKLSDLLTDYAEIKHVDLAVRRLDMWQNPMIGSQRGSIELLDPATLKQHIRDAQPHYQIKIKPSLKDLPFFINPIRFNDRSVRGRYTMPSTYVDWRYSNPDPMNVFRTFQYQEFGIGDLIDKDPSELIAMMRSWNGWNQSFDSLKMNWIPFWAHPMQYNARSIKMFVNAYNITEYFSKMGTDEALKTLRNQYRGILDKYMTRKELGYRETSVVKQFLLVIQVEKEFEFAVFRSKKLGARKKMGCPITSQVLNEARQRGSLFIRKCENGSYIHAFSAQLFATKSYLYKHLLKRS